MILSFVDMSLTICVLISFYIGFLNCENGDQIGALWTDSPETVLPTIQQLMESELLVYTGKKSEK